MLFNLTCFRDLEAPLLYILVGAARPYGVIEARSWSAFFEFIEKKFYLKDLNSLAQGRKNLWFLMLY